MSAISVVPAQVEDAPVLAAIASDSSESDAQTEMKGYGRAPFDISEYTRTSVPQHLKSPRIRTIKAVDEETGAIMGFCLWGFRRLTPPVFPCQRSPAGVQTTGCGE